MKKIMVVVVMTVVIAGCAHAQDGQDYDDEYTHMYGGIPAEFIMKDVHGKNEHIKTYLKIRDLYNGLGDMPQALEAHCSALLMEGILASELLKDNDLTHYERRRLKQDRAIVDREYEKCEVNFSKYPE